VQGTDMSASLRQRLQESSAPKIGVLLIFGRLTVRDVVADRSKAVSRLAPCHRNPKRYQTARICLASSGSNRLLPPFTAFLLGAWQTAFENLIKILL